MRVTTIFLGGNDYSILRDSDLNEGESWELDVLDGVLLCMVRYRDATTRAYRHDKRFLFAPGTWHKVRIDDA